MNVLIFGLGSIGKRHARLLRDSFGHAVTAFRTGLGQEANDLGIPELHSWEAVDQTRWDLAVIANPTDCHIATAQACAERGIPLFIEKPIDGSTNGLEKLLAEVERRRLTTYVAYPLRFHPVVQALRQALGSFPVWHARMVCTSYLPDWRPGQDVKKSYTAHRNRGGGVLLDLSHEIDLAQHLFGTVANMEGRCAKRGDVTVDAEDTADLLLQHSKGNTTNIHLNFMSRCCQRWVEVDTERVCWRADLNRNTLACSGGASVPVQSLQADKDAMYLAQWRYFFDNLHNPRLENNLFEATPLFRKIIALREKELS